MHPGVVCQRWGPSASGAPALGPNAEEELFGPQMLGFQHQCPKTGAQRGRAPVAGPLCRDIGVGNPCWDAQCWGPRIAAELPGPEWWGQATRATVWGPEGGNCADGGPGGWPSAPGPQACGPSARPPALGLGNWKSRSGPPAAGAAPPPQRSDKWRRRGGHWWGVMGQREAVAGLGGAPGRGARGGRDSGRGRGDSGQVWLFIRKNQGEHSGGK